MDSFHKVMEIINGTIVPNNVPGCLILIIINGQKI